MFSDHLAFLLSKQLSSSLTAEEEKELHILLQDEEARQSYQHLKRFWQEKEAAKSPNVDKALQAVMAQIQEEPIESVREKRQPIRSYAFALAAFVLLITIGVFYFAKKSSSAEIVASNNAQSKSPQGLVEKQNTKGTRSIITLADGSKVWLNADSRLQYPVAFEGATREVTLSGEAFFDVAKNKQKPFIIHLKNGTVKVLGTSFNIKAYDNSPSVETSVSTGRVAFIPARLSSGKKADTVFLTKDLKAVYTIETGAVKTMATSSKTDKAWTEGKLVFDGSSMDEVATTLERYFGKQVLINDEGIRAYHLTGTFEENSAEEILYYLSKSKPFTYRITETQIILSAVR